MSGSPTRCAGRTGKRGCNKLLWIQSIRPFHKSLDVSYERSVRFLNLRKLTAWFCLIPRMHDSFRGIRTSQEFLSPPRLRCILIREEFSAILSFTTRKLRATSISLFLIIIMTSECSVWWIILYWLMRFLLYPRKFFGFHVYYADNGEITAIAADEFNRRGLTVRTTMRTRGKCCVVKIAD